MLDSAHLELVLSPAEKALAFRKRNVVVDRDTISRVQLTEDPWTWLRGVRAPGTFVPATIAVGSWRYAGGKDFAVIRRSRPGVVIDLAGDGEFQRIVVSTRHGLALVKALRLEATDEAADVTAIVDGSAATLPGAQNPKGAKGAKNAKGKPRPATA